MTVTRRHGGRRTEAPWVFLGHTLERVGPPIFLLHFLRWLTVHTDQPVEVVSLADGPLRPDFEELGPVTVLDGEPAAPDPRLVHLDRLGLVYVNTAISVRAAPALPPGEPAWVAHVHELEVGLSLHGTRGDWRALDRPGTHWVAASRAVADNLVARHGVAPTAITVHHEMIDTSVPERGAGPTLRETLGLAPTARVVGTAAVVNWRKGPDLFLQLAWHLHSAEPGADLVWIGADGGHDSERFRDEVAAAGLDDRVHILDAVADPRPWLAELDVFVLTAREDAFPLACLEAAAAGCPVVCFESGGAPEFVQRDAGIVVPYPDVPALADAVRTLLGEPGRAGELGTRARHRVREHHEVDVAAPRLWADLEAWAR